MDTNFRYQRILENQTLAIMTFDLAWTLNYINPAGEVLLGTAANRLLGQSLDQIFPDQPAFIDGIRQAVSEGFGFTERDLSLGTASGRPARVDCIVNPICDTGVTEGVLLEVIPSERQLRIAKDENLSKQTSITRSIVRGLAHEIKNPLGGLRGAAQLLEKELPDNDLREYTNVIIGEADRLQNLVDRILGPNALPHMQDVNIHEVLERVRNLVAAEFPSRSPIITDYDPSIPDVRGDMDQLIQAVLNIVRNAVQATEATEGAKITLRTRAQRQFTIGQVRHRVALRVDVIDNGPGVPEHLVERVFYPMVTGRAEGTGLGLSISQSLVHQHGGLIELETQAGHTRFSIFLPFNAEEA